MIVPQMCRFCKSFLPKLPECHSTCSRNVQGIHTRRHGDDDRVVGTLYGRITKPLTLGSENDRKAAFTKYLQKEKTKYAWDRMTGAFIKVKGER